jgi:hypothetical protein
MKITIEPRLPDGCNSIKFQAQNYQEAFELGKLVRDVSDSHINYSCFLDGQDVWVKIYIYKFLCRAVD